MTAGVVSPNGVDNFHFWKRPLVLPDVDPAETNVYDMITSKNSMAPKAEGIPYDKGSR